MRRVGPAKASTLRRVSAEQDRQAQAVHEGELSTHSVDNLLNKDRTIRQKPSLIWDADDCSEFGQQADGALFRPY